MRYGILHRVAVGGEHGLANREVSTPRIGIEDGELANAARRTRRQVWILIVETHHEMEAAVPWGGVEITSGVLILAAVQLARQPVAVRRIARVDDVPLDLAAPARRRRSVATPAAQRPAGCVAARRRTGITGSRIPIIALFARVEGTVAAVRNRGEGL